MNNIFDDALYYQDGLDRRQIKTKKAIVKAFFDLTKEKDMSKITITELAKKADIDRKTFYLHFNSIADIYNELGEKVVDMLSKTITNFSDSGNFESPYDLFLTINKILSEKIDTLKEIACKNDFSEFAFKIKDAFCERLIVSYCNNGFSETERFKLIAEFIAAGTVSIYLRWLKGEVNISMDELALLATSMTINGVSGLERVLSNINDN